MRAKSEDQGGREIEQIELPPITEDGTGPRLVGGVARIVPRGWLKHRTSIRGRMIMVYPGRVWIRGDTRARHPWPGELVRVWCTPTSAAPAAPAGSMPASRRPALDGEYSLDAPWVWPECTAQSKVVSVLMNRRETIIELEIFPGQEGWTRLMRLYSQLRNTTLPR